MTNSNNQDKGKGQDQWAAQGGFGGEDGFWLSDENEEILDSIWRSPEMIEASVKLRDKEEGTAGKTLDWRTGQPLTPEEIEFNNHGPYSKGEKKRTAADWQRIYDYEAEQGIASTIPDEYKHFVPPISGISLQQPVIGKKPKSS